LGANALHGGEGSARRRVLSAGAWFMETRNLPALGVAIALAAWSVRGETGSRLTDLLRNFCRQSFAKRAPCCGSAVVQDRRTSWPPTGCAPRARACLGSAAAKAQR